MLFPRQSIPISLAQRDKVPRRFRNQPSRITVDLTGPTASVGSVDDLKFTASVKNTGLAAVKILKYGTILDEKLPTRSFTVTKDGATVPFTGVKLSVSLNDLDKSAFTTIPAGEAVTVNHEVAALFDFASVGPGKFSFEPIATFRVVDIEGAARFVKLPQLNKRAVDIRTTTTKKSFIDASYSECKSLAAGASSYISTHGADALYMAYFGNIPTSRVIAVYNAVANENSSSRTLSCVDSYGVCSGGVVAYTIISTTNADGGRSTPAVSSSTKYTANLCSGTPVSSRNVRGGTTLHELSHAVGATDDIIYGCAADQALSDADSFINADNYNCFATQVYANTRC